MSVAAVNQASEAAAVTACRHHWLIESPHGPTSLGRCKLCGAQKEFRNSGCDWLWEDEPLSELSYRPWGQFRESRAPVTEDG